MLATAHNTVERCADWLAWAENGMASLDRHGPDPEGPRRARNGRLPNGNLAAMHRPSAVSILPS